MGSTTSGSGSSTLHTGTYEEAKTKAEQELAKRQCYYDNDLQLLKSERDLALDVAVYEGVCEVGGSLKKLGKLGKLVELGKITCSGAVKRYVANQTFNIKLLHLNQKQLCDGMP